MFDPRLGLHEILARCLIDEGWTDAALPLGSVAGSTVLREDALSASNLGRRNRRRGSDRRRLSDKITPSFERVTRLF